MKRFKYKLNGITKVLVAVGCVLCLVAIAASVIKLIVVENNSYPSIVFNVITITFAVVFIVAFCLVLSIRYDVNAGGVRLVLGFFTIKNGSFSPEKIAAVVRKTKTNVLLIVSDLTVENPLGTIINIDSSLFEGFIKALSDSGISFDYIEDIE